MFSAGGHCRPSHYGEEHVPVQARCDCIADGHCFQHELCASHPNSNCSANGHPDRDYRGPDSVAHDPANDDAHSHLFANTYSNGYAERNTNYDRDTDADGAIGDTDHLCATASHRAACFFLE